VIDVGDDAEIAGEGGVHEVERGRLSGSVAS